MIEIIKAESYLRRLHMSNVHSSRIIKMAQLRLRLANQLIKRRLIDSKIKIKKVTRLSHLMRSRCSLDLDSYSLLIHKAS